MDYYIINRNIGTLAVLFVVVGCGHRTSAPASKEIENTVRDTIAENFRVAPHKIEMNRPLSAPPLNADDLDVVELVMELEERFSVSIPDSLIEKHGGDDLRITPAQLVLIIQLCKSNPRSQ